MNVPVVELGSRVSALGRRLPTRHRAYSVTITHCFFSLFLTFCNLLLTSNSFAAASQPPGDFVDVSVLAGDENVACSYFSYKQKITPYFVKIDGSKFEKKNFWSSSAFNVEISPLAKKVKALKKQKSPKGKKEYKKQKARLDKLVKAKNQLKSCISVGKAQAVGVPVTFEHVQPVIQSKCMNCHTALGWQNSEAFFKDSGRVVPAALDASPFYTFLSNNPEGYQPAYMPKGVPALSDQNLLLLGRWILGINQPVPPTATPGGVEGEGRNKYNAKCSGCHGLVDVSSKAGRTAAQINAAMNSVPQMLFLRNQLSSSDVENIALALSHVAPAQEGTVSITSLGPVAEGNPGGPQAKLMFQVRFSGTASQPFSVGFVTTNGSAMADSDFEFMTGTLNFEGFDQETKIIEVPIYADTFQEQDETMFVDIGGISYGGVRVGVSTATGVIANDDATISYPPPLAQQVKAAFGFNGDYSDALGLAPAQPQTSVSFTSTSEAKVGSAAVRFDDANDHLLLSAKSFESMSNFTLATWVYWENSSSTSSRIFDFGSSGSNYIYFLPKDTANRCRFELRGTGTAVFTLQCNAGVALPNNQWVHVAVTFNAATDEMKIFFDGQQVAARTGVTPAMSTLVLSDNKIARSRVSGNVDFVGRLDELIVWDAALTQPQIDQVKNMTGTPTFNSGLEVRLDGQLLGNGATLDFGQIQTGESLYKTLFVQNNGFGVLGLLSDPMVEIGGADASQYSIEVQPMPWQQMIGAGSMATFVLKYSPTLSGTKLATLLIDNSDQALGNFALLVRGSAIGDPVEEPSGGGGDDPALVEGRELYAMNCASCHGTLNQSAKLGATLQRVTDALDPVSGVPQMRSLGLTSDQIQKVVLALNSVSSEAEQLPRVGDSVITIGTARYVQSALTDIFLPADPASYLAQDTTIQDIISQGVIGRSLSGTVFAGRASFFSNPTQRFDTFHQDEEIGNSLRPFPNTIRSGLLGRVCDLIVEQDRAVTTALAKASYDPTQSVTPAAVKDLYEKLFAPGQILPMYIAESVSSFPNGAAGYTQTDKWRFVLDFFCTSGVIEGI